MGDLFMDWKFWAWFTSIALIVLPILYIVIYRKYLSKRLQKCSKKYPPRYNGKNTDLLLGSGNGIGFTLLGDDFRYHNGSCVNYHFFTFLYIPIIPIGCYRVSEGARYSSSHKHETVNYCIYGTERWSFLEVIHCYLQRLSVFMILIGITFVFSLVFE